VPGEWGILLDSGISRGSDIAKACALGADAVLLGRATLFGVAVGGQAGAAHALGLLEQELRRVLGLVGTPKLADLDHSKLGGLRSAPGEYVVPPATDAVHPTRGRRAWRRRRRAA